MAKPSTNAKGEDTTPHNPPATAQGPAKKSRPGWQSPPETAVETSLPCPHLGVFSASMDVHRYPLGTEWVCGCGQVFVVAVNAGDKRTLRKKEVVEAEIASASTESTQETDDTA